MRLVRLPSDPQLARQGARALATVLGLGLLAALWSAAAQASDAAPTIAAAELAERLEAGDAPVILDVRTPGEYRDGHIPGAVNIPHDQLAERLEEVPARRDEEVVVHCHSGKRAGMAEDVLRGAGYTRVRDLEDHWKGWSDSDLPTE